MLKASLLSAAAVTAILFSSSVSAETADRHEPGYFLMKTRAGVQVNQRIVTCPSTVDRRAHVVTTMAISAQPGPDASRFFRVDTSGRFLSSRTVHLGLRPDGTLTSFNATTEGQGGAVLSAAIGVAASLGAMAIGVPPLGAAAAAPAAAGVDRDHVPDPQQVRCNAQTLTQVLRAAEIERQLAALRARIAQGTAPDNAAQVMTELADELAELVDALTLASDAALFDPTPDQFGTGPAGSRTSHIPPIDYAPWFRDEGESDAAWRARGVRIEELLTDSHVPGRYGFRAHIAPDPDLLRWFGQGDGTSLPSDPNAPASFIYYRRPVPATISAAPCPSQWVDGDCATPHSPPSGQWYPTQPTARQTIQFPQLSGIFSLALGHHGIFGTHKTSADFNDQGAPTTLEIGADAGGAGIATVITAAGAAIPTLRDARTDAINRRLDREKAMHDLNEILNQPATAPAPAPAAGQ